MLLGGKGPFVQFRAIPADHPREWPDPTMSPHVRRVPAGPHAAAGVGTFGVAVRTWAGGERSGRARPARPDPPHLRRHPGPAEALGLGVLGHRVAETDTRADLGGLCGHRVRPLPCRRPVELQDQRPYPHPSRIGGDSIAVGGLGSEGLVAARLRRDQRRRLAAAPEPVEQRPHPIAHQHLPRFERTRQGIDHRRARAVGAHRIGKRRQPDPQLAHQRRMVRGLDRADARLHHPRVEAEGHGSDVPRPRRGAACARVGVRAGPSVCWSGPVASPWPPSASATASPGSPPAPPAAHAPQPHPPGRSLPCGTGFRRHLLVLAVPGRFLSLARGEDRRRPRRFHRQPQPPRLLRDARRRAEVSTRFHAFRPEHPANEETEAGRKDTCRHPTRSRPSLQTPFPSQRSQPDR